jgi:hypothetical protein
MEANSSIAVWGPFQMSRLQLLIYFSFHFFGLTDEGTYLWAIIMFKPISPVFKFWFIWWNWSSDFYKQPWYLSTENDCIAGLSSYSTCQSLGRYCPKLQRIDLGSCSAISDLSLKALADDCRSLTHINISWCDHITENGKTVGSWAVPAKNSTGNPHQNPLDIMLRHELSL